MASVIRHYVMPQALLYSAVLLVVTVAVSLGAADDTTVTLNNWRLSSNRSAAAVVLQWRWVYNSTTSGYHSVLPSPELPQGGDYAVTLNVTALNSSMTVTVLNATVEGGTTLLVNLSSLFYAMLSAPGGANRSTLPRVTVNVSGCTFDGGSVLQIVGMPPGAATAAARASMVGGSGGSGVCYWHGEAEAASSTVADGVVGVLVERCVFSGGSGVRLGPDMGLPAATVIRVQDTVLTHSVGVGGAASALGRAGLPWLVEVGGVDVAGCATAIHVLRVNATVAVEREAWSAVIGAAVVALVGIGNMVSSGSMFVLQRCTFSVNVTASVGVAEPVVFEFSVIRFDGGSSWVLRGAGLLLVDSSTLAASLRLEGTATTGGSVAVTAGRGGGAAAVLHAALSSVALSDGSLVLVANSTLTARADCNGTSEPVPMRVAAGLWWMGASSLAASVGGAGVLLSGSHVTATAVAAASVAVLVSPLAGLTVSNGGVGLCVQASSLTAESMVAVSRADITVSVATAGVLFVESTLASSGAGSVVLRVAGSTRVTTRSNCVSSVAIALVTGSASASMGGTIIEMTAADGNGDRVPVLNATSVIDEALTSASQFPHDVMQPRCATILLDRTLVTVEGPNSTFLRIGRGSNNTSGARVQLRSQLETLYASPPLSMNPSVEWYAPSRVENIFINFVSGTVRDGALLLDIAWCRMKAVGVPLTVTPRIASNPPTNTANIDIFDSSITFADRSGLRVEDCELRVVSAISSSSNFGFYQPDSPLVIVNGSFLELRRLNASIETKQVGNNVYVTARGLQLSQQSRVVIADSALWNRMNVTNVHHSTTELSCSNCSNSNIRCGDLTVTEGSTVAVERCTLNVLQDVSTLALLPTVASELWTAHVLMVSISATTGIAIRFDGNSSLRFVDLVTWFDGAAGSFLQLPVGAALTLGGSSGDGGVVEIRGVEAAMLPLMFAQFVSLTGVAQITGPSSAFVVHNSHITITTVPSETTQSATANAVVSFQIAQWSMTSGGSVVLRNVTTMLASNRSSTSLCFLIFASSSLSVDGFGSTLVVDGTRVNITSEGNMAAGVVFQNSQLLVTHGGVVMLSNGSAWLVTGGSSSSATAVLGLYSVFVLSSTIRVVDEATMTWCSSHSRLGVTCGPMATVCSNILVTGASVMEVAGTSSVYLSRESTLTVRLDAPTPAAARSLPCSVYVYQSTVTVANGSSLRAAGGLWHVVVGANVSGASSVGLLFHSCTASIRNGSSMQLVGLSVTVDAAVGGLASSPAGAAVYGILWQSTWLTITSDSSFRVTDGTAVVTDAASGDAGTSSLAGVTWASCSIVMGGRSDVTILNTSIVVQDTAPPSSECRHKELYGVLVTGCTLQMSGNSSWVVDGGALSLLSAKDGVSAYGASIFNSYSVDILSGSRMVWRNVEMLAELASSESGCSSAALARSWAYGFYFQGADLRVDGTDSGIEIGGCNVSLVFGGGTRYASGALVTGGRLWVLNGARVSVVNTSWVLRTVPVAGCLGTPLDIGWVSVSGISFDSLTSSPLLVANGSSVVLDNVSIAAAVGVCAATSTQLDSLAALRWTAANVSIDSGSILALQRLNISLQAFAPASYSNPNNRSTVRHVSCIVLSDSSLTVTDSSTVRLQQLWVELQAINVTRAADTHRGYFLYASASSSSGSSDFTGHLVALDGNSSLIVGGLVAITRMVSITSSIGLPMLDGWILLNRVALLVCNGSTVVLNEMTLGIENTAGIGGVAAGVVSVLAFTTPSPLLITDAPLSVVVSPVFGGAAQRGGASLLSLRRIESVTASPIALRLMAALQPISSPFVLVGGSGAAYTCSQCAIDVECRGVRVGGVRPSTVALRLSLLLENVSSSFLNVSGGCRALTDSPSVAEQPTTSRSPSLVSSSSVTRSASVTYTRTASSSDRTTATSSATPTAVTSLSHSDTRSGSIAYLRSASVTYTRTASSSCRTTATSSATPTAVTSLSHSDTRSGSIAYLRSASVTNTHTLSLSDRTSATISSTSPTHSSTVTVCLTRSTTVPQSGSSSRTFVVSLSTVFVSASMPSLITSSLAASASSQSSCTTTGAASSTLSLPLLDSRQGLPKPPSAAASAGVSAVAVILALTHGWGGLTASTAFGGLQTGLRRLMARGDACDGSLDAAFLADAAANPLQLSIAIPGAPAESAACVGAAVGAVVILLASVVTSWMFNVVAVSVSGSTSAKSPDAAADVWTRRVTRIATAAWRRSGGFVSSYVGAHALLQQPLVTAAAGLLTITAAGSSPSAAAGTVCVALVAAAAALVPVSVWGATIGNRWQAAVRTSLPFTFRQTRSARLLPEQGNSACGGIPMRVAAQLFGGGWYYAAKPSSSRAVSDVRPYLEVIKPYWPWRRWYFAVDFAWNAAVGMVGGVGWGVSWCGSGPNIAAAVLSVLPAISLVLLRPMHRRLELVCGVVLSCLGTVACVLRLTDLSDAAITVMSNVLMLCMLLFGLGATLAGVARWVYGVLVDFKGDFNYPLNTTHRADHHSKHATQDPPYGDDWSAAVVAVSSGGGGGSVRRPLDEGGRRCRFDKRSEEILSRLVTLICCRGDEGSSAHDALSSLCDTILLGDAAAPSVPNTAPILPPFPLPPPRAR